MEGFIHSTESFGTVDGPGIRFVIFFQGCPMRCLYCHNPDTWKIGTGTKRTVESLLAEYDSVKEFMKNGGITCTGGEPLVQIDFVTELLKRLRKRGYTPVLTALASLLRLTARKSLKGFANALILLCWISSTLTVRNTRSLRGTTMTTFLRLQSFVGAWCAYMDTSCCCAGYHGQGRISFQAGRVYLTAKDAEGS